MTKKVQPRKWETSLNNGFPLFVSCPSVFVRCVRSSKNFLPLLPVSPMPTRYSALHAFHFNDSAKMGLLPLGVALIVLMIDSAIELAFISSMVGYLHRSGANTYPFSTSNSFSSVPSLVYLNAKPKGLLLNEGHTSNGAAGTALILICFGGFITLWHLRRRQRMVSAT
jgi:hypothetical protein